MEAFGDPEVAGVVCSRGGYGCARLFPYLDLDAMAASCKMFCGFSDITTLHLALNRRGLVTMHTPMLLTLSVEREPWVVESFTSLLKGSATVPAGAPVGETLIGGKGEGQVVGGCLSLLSDSIGTPDAFETQGRILVLEDVDEAPHRVDAVLTHFLNAGLLKNAAGIVVGEMTNTDEKLDDKIGGWSWRRIVEDRIAPLGVPTVVNFPFGHMRNMLSLPLGIGARLDADAGTLTYTESPCS
jgi:muramoyltetrapeptide carboxypeptidase